MSQWKDNLYNRIVRKNERVRRAYERYVAGHIKEHGKHRLKHWLVLLLLRWKYRESQKDRLHRFHLLKIKDGRARLRMEKIFGAVCYNLYRSQDGVHYRFLEKLSSNVYTTAHIPPDTIYFYKFKVSMDGTYYSEFSQVVSVSTVEDEHLYLARKLAQMGSPGAERSGKQGGADTGRNESGKRGSFLVEAVSLPQGGIRLDWAAPAGALHYNVYRAGGREEYRFVTQTTRNGYLDPELSPGEYRYQVKYTCDNRRYQLLGETPCLQAQAPVLGAGGRLYEKGAESEASNRITPMNFAKGLMPYEVISFDIFDTLILRPFSVPSDLFVLVGERLDIMDFCQIRKQAEQQARNDAYQKRGNKEVTLEQIYEYVSRETGIDAGWGMQTEFETELALCRPNPYMQTVYKLMREQGKTLVALSDMYLSKEWMRKLLASCGYEDWDRVIVSCDYNCSKRNGGLYDILKDLYPQETVHIGDNRKSDYDSAVQKGIAARLYQNVNEAGNQFRARGMSHLAGSAYRGVVNARLHTGMDRYSPYYEVGYVYTGIYVMGFCQWIYRYAREHGLDKILFLAREGDLYQKVFRQMYPDFPTEYVLWSRVPVAKTIVEKNRHPYLLQLVHHKANALYKSRVGTLFDRIGIGPLKVYFPRYRIREQEYLSPANEKVVYSLLTDHWDEVCGCYQADQEYIREYLTRKIGKSSRAAVVDVGWSGNNVLQVKYLTEQVYHLDCQVHCLLAASRNVNDTYMAAMMQKGEVETYIFSNMYNKTLHDLHQAGNNHLNSFFFEILTQSCTPTFLGFDAGGRILYDIPETENYAHNREIHQGTLDFVQDYREWFEEFPYMMDISGHDAYMPFLHFAGNLSWMRKYFADYIFGRDLFATQERAVMESVRQVMEKAKVWEETT